LVFYALACCIIVDIKQANPIDRIATTADTIPTISKVEFFILFPCVNLYTTVFSFLKININN